jgi:hypothetical protein
MLYFGDRAAVLNVRFLRTQGVFHFVIRTGLPFCFSLYLLRASYMLPTPVCEYNYVLPSLKIKLGCGWLMYVLRYMRWTIDGTYYARRGAGGRTGWIGICGEQLYACAAAISRARMGNAATAHGLLSPFSYASCPHGTPGHYTDHIGGRLHVAVSISSSQRSSCSVASKPRTPSPWLVGIWRQLPWRWWKEDVKISIVCFRFPYVSESLACPLSLVSNSSCNKWAVYAFVHRGWILYPLS